jgi:hypothetical protein
MTPVTRTLTALLLGVPGFMMLLGGGVSCVLTCAGIAKGSIPLFPSGVVALAIASIVASIGFLMFSFGEILSGKLPHRIPGRHVPASLALGLASLLSACSVLCTLVAATSAVTSRQAAWPWFAALVISVLLVSAVLSIRTSVMRKWREESPEADPTQRP